MGSASLISLGQITGARVTSRAGHSTRSSEPASESAKGEHPSYVLVLSSVTERDTGDRNRYGCLMYVCI